MNRLFYLILVLGISYSQNTVADEFYLNDARAYRSSSDGLLSNIISEIVIQGDSTVWLGTGRGISRVVDSLTITTLDTISTDIGTVVMNYGISAITSEGNKVAFAAATSDNEVSVGAGIYVTSDATDSLITWTYHPQPVDGQADSLAPFADGFFRALPVTTDHQNVTYDASMSGNYIWIASWAGGIRRFDILENAWDRIPLPIDGEEGLITCADSVYETISGKSVLKNFYLNPRDPSLGNHNHKGFSVLAYSDTIWVGTANGINLGVVGSNGCIDWVHYFYPLDNVTGNFVVGLAKQDWNGVRKIWAACLNADDPTEDRGLAWTDNDGLTWNRALVGERIYNVTAKDSIILAASDKGLWKSEDGQTWALFKPAKDATPMQSDEILSDQIYAAVIDDRMYYSDPVIWIGTRDGLARSTDLDGSAWKIFRAEYDADEVYAYPNPFSPNSHNTMDGDGYVRIHTDVTTSFVIDLTVYNFAMEQVISTQFDRRKNEGTLKWNGKDNNGRIVDNGTYFLSLNYDNKTEWVKLIVIK
ncbi:MAG: hypothetical protein HQ509_04940 [Candidatus Marinimicrobia bacterium]|nr:hypothetical protein [Candidatus Neomarinimicrobiota bacterium]